MAGAMRPEEMRREVERVRTALARLEQEYRWMYGAAYSTTGRGLGAARSQGAEGGPVLSIITSEQKEKWRTKLQEASRLLEAGAGSVIGAANLVTIRYRMRDVIGAPEPRGNVRRSEFEESVAARDRRVARGESFGEA